MPSLTSSRISRQRPLAICCISSKQPCPPSDRDMWRLLTANPCSYASFPGFVLVNLQQFLQDDGPSGSLPTAA